MRRHSSSKKARHVQKMVFSQACFAQDVIPESKLKANLDRWKEELSKATEPDYITTCKNMIKLYDLRISRLGVHTPCEG